MSNDLVPSFVADDLAKVGVVAEPATLEALAAYLDLMLEVNQRINLTGIRDRDEAWRRHIIDSLTLVPGMIDVADGSRIVDVGSGGGLPGIPLAIALPNLSFTLIEATGKKARFLQQVVDELGLSHVTIVNERAERVGHDPAHRAKYDVAVCRAVGPLRELLEYTLPLVAVGGRLLAMKGPSVESELADAGDALATLGAGELEIFEAYPPAFELNTVIVSVSKDNPTPRPYPRQPGTPRQSPL